MNIINLSRTDLTPVEIYKLTKNATVSKLTTAPDDEPLTVGDWVLFEDTNQATGEARTVLSVQLNGEYYATNSSTFIREFADLVEIFKDLPLPEIVKVTAKSKAGRTFITCALA